MTKKYSFQEFPPQFIAQFFKAAFPIYCEKYVILNKKQTLQHERATTFPTLFSENQFYIVHCLQTGYFLQQRENFRHFYKAHNTPSPSKEVFSENDGYATENRFWRENKVF